MLGDTTPLPHPVRGGVTAVDGGEGCAEALGVCFGLPGAVLLLLGFVPCRCCCRCCSCWISNSESRGSWVALLLVVVLEVGMDQLADVRGGVVDSISLVGLVEGAGTDGVACVDGASAVDAVRELLRRLRFFLPAADGA